MSFQVILGFPGGTEGKESACNAGDWGSIPGLERSLGEGNGLPGEYHRLRSLVGNSPQGCKELDITERLSTQAGYLLSGQMWLPLEVWGRMNTLRTVPPTFLSSPRYRADQ